MSAVRRGRFCGEDRHCLAMGKNERWLPGGQGGKRHSNLLGSDEEWLHNFGAVDLRIFQSSKKNNWITRMVYL